MKEGIHHGGTEGTEGESCCRADTQRAGIVALRYLNLILTSSPIFLCLISWGAANLPMWDLLTLGILAVTLGLLCGFYMSREIRENLLHGKSSILIRRPPGGVLFFVLLGVAGGISVFGLFALWGNVALYVASLLAGLVPETAFLVVGFHVLVLERRHGSKVYFYPDGFHFGDEL